MTEYLSVEQIIYIHGKAIEKFGGVYGIRDKAILDSAAARPMATFGGKDLYGDIYSKAAALCHSILINHPFIDGNKRCAFASMDIFLQENGVIITASDDECENVVLKLISKKIDDKALAFWLKDRAKIW